MKLEFPDQILEKSSNVKFHENPSSGVDMFNADRQTDRKTGMTQSIVVFRNFAYAPDDWPRRPTFSLSSGLLVNIENYLKLHHNRFLPHPFQFILQVNTLSSQPFEMASDTVVRAVRPCVLIRCLLAMKPAVWSLINIGSVEFSSGQLGASLIHSGNDTGMASEGQQLLRSCHFSVITARIFVSQKLSIDL